MSQRKETLIITPKHQVESFVFRDSSLWNTFRTLPEGREIREFTVEISFLKSKTRSLVLKRQEMGIKRNGILKQTLIFRISDSTVTSILNNKINCLEI